MRSASVRTLVIGILTLLLGQQVAGHAIAAQDAPQFCLHGCPTGTPTDNRFIARSVYALSNNGKTKFADWVAYRIEVDSIGPERNRSWKADPALEENDTLEPEDYEGAYSQQSLDLGHLAPLASLSARQEWAVTNYLSNIVPQKATLNRGVWSRLEAAERSIVKDGKAGAVYVLTGPIYEAEMAPLPGADEPHRVPSGFWKIVAVTSSGRIKTASFIVPQNIGRGTKYCDYLTPIESIEQRTGLKFFPSLRKIATRGVPRGKPLLAADLGCAGDP